ncbi:MAG: GIY-YIG nuclease family protein [Nitrososphaerota archaeon]|nr:GIY-YIG nuclease family protein [Aigarchaeota archaeon]MDW8076277.1 GIY-YIG nuclease family protein [Nitrososphaerota archaeon]
MTSKIVPGLYGPEKVKEIFKNFSGGYLLLIKLYRACNVTFGSAGTMFLKPGYYVYAGSAMGKTGWRLLRHVGPFRKRPHWHIDRLLNKRTARVVAIGVLPSRRKTECALSHLVSSMAEYSLVGVGSTDCCCLSHLHYFKRKSDAVKAIRKAINKVKVKVIGK